MNKINRRKREKWQPKSKWNDATKYRAAVWNATLAFPVSRLVRISSLVPRRNFYMFTSPTHLPTYQKDAATGSCVKSNHICSLNAIPLSSPLRAMAVLELYFFYVYVCIVCLSVCVCDCLLLCYTRHVRCDSSNRKEALWERRWWFNRYEMMTAYLFFTEWTFSDCLRKERNNRRPSVRKGYNIVMMTHQSQTAKGDRRREDERRGERAQYFEEVRMLLH